MVTLDGVERPTTLAGNGRRLPVVGSILLATLVGTSIKLWWAANTIGTNDVHNWQAFAAGVRIYGPIGLYGHQVIRAPYNHPPLMGRMLELINMLTDAGASFPFLIRLPATIADVFTPILLYLLIRQRRSVTEATVGAVACALSPVLLVISGFHGNTDPVFVLFAILSLYLLTAHRSTPLAGLAGICFGVSISVKLVPIVVAPILLLLAWRSGVRRLIAFLVGVAAFMAPFWIPVAVANWGPFRQNVLGYAGYGGLNTWGLLSIMHVTRMPAHWVELVQGPGRFVVLVLTAGVPVLIAWRRPRAAVPAFGLTLAGFLLLTTTFGTQYLAWAVAATFLVNVWAGVAYSAAAGALLISVYDRWNDAVPWRWNEGFAQRGMTHQQTIMAGIVWVILLVGVVGGMWWSLRGDARDRQADGAPRWIRSLSPWRTNSRANSSPPERMVRDTPSVEVKG